MRVTFHADETGRRAGTVDLPPGAELRIRHPRHDGALDFTVQFRAEQAPPPDQILQHLVRAFRSEKKTHSDVLCARLAEDHPTLYKDWTPYDLSAVLRRHGIRSLQLWSTPLEGGAKCNRKGFKRQAVLDKIAERRVR